jgi:hypothetical protein
MLNRKPAIFGKTGPSHSSNWCAPPAIGLMFSLGPIRGEGAEALNAGFAVFVFTKFQVF